jgi:REP element-mobilizing transposase RayT
MHVVMRSEKAKGAMSLLKHNRKIEDLLFAEASKNHVKLHAAANAGNHLHLLVQAPSREHLSNFLRAVSGRVAMVATGARKGKKLSAPKASGTATQTKAVRPEGFWDQRPFTRLVSLGRDFTHVCRYIALNSTETFGRMKRETVRALFAQIRQLIQNGQIARSPSLQAAGFF